MRSEILVTAPYGIVKLEKCSECKALVAPEDKFDHDRWHNRLDERLTPFG